MTKDAHAEAFPGCLDTNHDPCGLVAIPPYNLPLSLTLGTLGYDTENAKSENTETARLGCVMCGTVHTLPSCPKDALENEKGHLEPITPEESFLRGPHACYAKGT